MENKNKIIKLFEKYGFKYRNNNSNKLFLTFTYRAGFFHNAELVALEQDKSEDLASAMSEKEKELVKLGFSAKQTFYKSIDDIESGLFHGFFDVQNWREKIKGEYESHCKRVLSVLPEEASNYEYIDASFAKNGKPSEGSIIESVIRDISSEGPSLTIIEAPAGFGKTCTSYEIINSLADKNDDNPIPFFTEFSRDRQARVFSHIFVQEVDRSFSSVNSKVVIDEVKNGRIVVVLDGFDELLHDSGSNVSSDLLDKKFESAEPMLETISELLVKNAKLILTSRRSAIFEGEAFGEWVSRYENKFSINRYRLNKPTISEWLPYNRIDSINETGLDISNLSNPVLLGYLRALKDDDLNKLCESGNKIVDYYFNAMLEREMERQELIMSPQQQTKMLKIVAMDMCDNNYTSDSKDKIISLIKNQCSSLLNEVRLLYPLKNKPSIDKLATTLSNHAFFDRSNQGDNNIEFVNEFVFGNYIASGVLDKKSEWICSDERFVEPAVLSFISRTPECREHLWKKIKPMCEFVDKSVRMKYESVLLQTVEERTYDHSELTSLVLKDICLFKESKIVNAVFNECVFEKVILHVDNFEDITFLNCSFWNCSSAGVGIGKDLNFYNCKDNNGLIESLELVVDEEIERTSHNEVETYILSRIWPKGSTSLDRLHFFTALLYRTDEFTKKDITKAIKSLKRKDILNDANDSNFIAINKHQITEIKKILNR